MDSPEGATGLKENCYIITYYSYYTIFYPIIRYYTLFYHAGYGGSAALFWTLSYIYIYIYIQLVRKPRHRAPPGLPKGRKTWFVDHPML